MKLVLTYITNIYVYIATKKKFKYIINYFLFIQIFQTVICIRIQKEK